MISPDQFQDVIPLMDRALFHNGLIFKCATEAQAVKIVQRCCKWRVADRKNGDGRSMFDLLVIKRRGDTIIFEVREPVKGEMFTMDGKKLDWEQEMFPTVERTPRPKLELD